MKEQIIKFWRDEEGATAIEYGLIAGLIAVGLVVALTALGGDLSALFNLIGTKLPKT
ncbi:Flp family type IVb pilin [Comamonas sp. Y33R10-2]|uniref:Flp family type IVb pilin n=1 Tax=Comamonas sp. Y33R10-2 TaxID=2853257 RepID=UPI001C5C97A2|nr:Flp family type IVb pilin [Comamonas sp. Y33R10-2]QXZ09107.1 Flp family type IVb pilin [Comamonas sp. Y33R10-2]